MKIGAIEAGGTKMVCGIGDESGAIHDSMTFPTTEPAETIPRILEYFAHHSLVSLGIGSFGPVEVNPASAKFGTITTTPKLAWQDFDWLGALSPHLQCPIAIDTDVNAAALGESRYGAARGLRNCVYITVGTGIGGGLLVEGQLVHGMMHPEMGHMLIRRHPDDTYKGHCPYHGDCLEGLASGPALADRFGQKAETLGDDHIGWSFEAYYLAQAAANLVLTVSPERIILGGGVLHQAGLIERVRGQVHDLLHGYVSQEAITEQIDDYIVLPGLGNFAGLKGALALALDKPHSLVV